MTAPKKRAIIAELERDPHRSFRAIAHAVGCRDAYVGRIAAMLGIRPPEWRKHKSGGVHTKSD